jgi:hypothetical protein
MRGFELEMGKYLVVAHQTAESPELLARLQELSQRDPTAEFVVLVPATPISFLKRPPTSAAPTSAAGVPAWTAGGDDEKAWERARHVAESAGTHFMEAGLRVIDARAGDSSPLKAIDNEVADNGYEAVVISTLKPGMSRWLGMDLLSRTTRQFPQLRVIHVVPSSGTP